MGQFWKVPNPDPIAAGKTSGPMMSLAGNSNQIITQIHQDITFYIL